jgi:hypothetical protein
MRHLEEARGARGQHAAGKELLEKQEYHPAGDDRGRDAGRPERSRATLK